MPSWKDVKNGIMQEEILLISEAELSGSRADKMEAMSARNKGCWEMFFCLENKGINIDEPIKID